MRFKKVRRICPPVLLRQFMDLGRDAGLQAQFPRHNRRAAKTGRRLVARLFDQRRTRDEVAQLPSGSRYLRQYAAS